MTKGELGEELSDIAGMAAAGVPVLSEDGKSVMKASLCKQAMKPGRKPDFLFLTTVRICLFVETAA